MVNIRQWGGEREREGGRERKVMTTTVAMMIAMARMYGWMDGRKAGKKAGTHIRTYPRRTRRNTEGRRGMKGRAEKEQEGRKIGQQ
jgi:hypothetical protein